MVIIRGHAGKSALSRVWSGIVSVTRRPYGQLRAGNPTMLEITPRLRCLTTTWECNLQFGHCFCRYCGRWERFPERKELGSREKEVLK